MDIGYYCLASALALWGEPEYLQAQATLLESGVDGHGVVTLHYGDFDVTLLHSKVSDSHIPSEIQGEAGSLVIEKLAETQRITLIPRGGAAQDLTPAQHVNTMRYEAEHFAGLVAEQRIEHSGLALARSTARLLTEIRRQTGVVFPADSKNRSS